MRKILVVVLVSLLAVACTVKSDDLQNADAAKAYLLPALCQRQSECVPALFVTVFGPAPNNQSQCVAMVFNKLSQDDRTRISNCTNDQWKTCAADTKAAACPTDPAKNGVPEIPASCQGC